MVSRSTENPDSRSPEKMTLKPVRRFLFWVAAVCFFSGIMLARYLIDEEGVTLLPGTGGDFTLQSESGPVSLQDFRGKVVALYFGYMTCPDICPTSMWKMAEAIRALPADKADQVQGIMISVDPDRDSTAALAIYTAGFNPDFIGLTGTARAIDKVASQYGVIYYKVPLEDSAVGYVVDHSSVVYLVDRDGKLSARMPHASTIEDITGTLLKLLES